MDVNLPTTPIYPVGNPAMYCRLMVPQWYGCDAVWLDADQVVLKPLDPLFETDYGDSPCAAVESTSIGNQVEGVTDNTPALYAGLIVFNHRAWTQQRVTERCFETMNTSTLVFKYVVQSVLSYVLKGDFHRLHPMWQRFGNRTHESIPADAKVVHWHGHSRNPWMCTMANQNLWEEYA
jgi:lipopolysaccharide biosynthesis glycosyltransferase